VAAGDRIQQIMSDSRHLHTPPIPLVPYAVGLSLTVAYRGLRDQHADVTKVRQDLAARCKILEALSTRWWTADAMAKLGRKALKNIEQTGLSRRTMAILGEEMEAEVTPCKYGPFDHRRSGAATDDVQEGSNALHVLSNVAATHAAGGGLNTQLLTSSNDGETTMSEHHDALGAATTLGTSYDLDAFEQMQDLDHLFDGFFDLSMPTIFQDPLFEGAMFLNHETNGKNPSHGYVTYGIDDTMGRQGIGSSSHYPEFPLH